MANNWIKILEFKAKRNQIGKNNFYYLRNNYLPKNKLIIDWKNLI
jgi:hypothetical protein